MYRNIIGSLKSWLWPVEAKELAKFLPLFLIKMCASFNFSVLATIKDTVIVTSNGGGAEVIPVLKGGMVIIFAFLAMLFYSKLSNHVSRRNLFYIMLLPFLVFFLFYGFVLFPHQDLLSPQISADWLLSKVGAQHGHWIAVYRYWMHAIFFVMAELWGGVVISLLFWGFVNQITSIKDAARFYVLYSIGGHIGTLLSGGLVYTCTSLLNKQDYQTTITTLMLIVSSICFLIMILYKYANQKIIKQQDQGEMFAVEMESKTTLSLKESILYIIRSPYLGLIAMMVIGYGLSMNLVEVTWKSLVKIQYPDPNAYQSYMGIMQFVLGIASIILALFFSGSIMRKFGWYISAQLTPVLLGITSLIFFVVYFSFHDIPNNTASIFSITPLMLLVIIGGFHNITCKSLKYCLFDTTKEMAYIPLDAESKTKGKAAVDLVGARFGKTGAAWIQLLLIDLIGSGSILSVVPLLVPAVLIVVILWLRAVFNLNGLFKNIQQETPAKNTQAIAI